jgi:hypothetical protein
VLLGSGQDFILIPGVSDGDEGLEQEIVFSVTSSDPSILSVDGVTYSTGQTLALISVTEKGIAGSVSLQVEATDVDGTASTSLNVEVKGYNNPGINFEIHDIVFWQEVIPLQSNPSFSMIAPDAEAPYDQIDLAVLNLSVFSDCKDSPPCTGTDFFTSLAKGYLIPEVSGEYTFYAVAGDRKTVGLSSDADFGNAVTIIQTGNQRPTVGQSSGNKEHKSAPVNLEAGKTYAIYASHWNIHTLMGGILWEGPGIEKQYIPGKNLSFVNDVEKPTVPGNFRIVTTGTDDVLLAWDEASDNLNLAGYRIYVNGVPHNQEPIQENEYIVEGLSSGSPYCVVVTSLDRAGNESAASEVLCTTTWITDDVPPMPPTSVEAAMISDLFIQLTWSGATDAETEIRGYRVYVDGVLFNDADLVYGEDLLVTGLVPETDYQVEIEALDAGLNVSEKSDVLVVSTTAFDPMDTSISDKKVRMKVNMEPVGRSNGIGVNIDYRTGSFLNDADQVRLMKELEVAAVRWGALTANPLSFSEYSGSGKAMTIAKFMNFCNEIGAYTVFCAGVEDATDWRTDPQTFVNFLEYLAGPSSSTYGAIRAGEGFTEPLLDASKGLIFEFGNEVWGASAHNAQIGGDYVAYGDWCREMATLMKASDYFDPEKIFLVYSGRDPDPGEVGSQFLHDRLFEGGDQGEVDWLALSGYMGGNLNYSPEVDPGKSELDYFKNGIAYMNKNLDGLIHTMDQVLSASGSFKPTYFYEANMTNSSFFGRLGQAIVQTDYYASAVERGGAIPTVFHLTGGQWKMTIPSQDYKKLPLFYTTQLYNRFCKGNALEVELETMASVPNYPNAGYPLDPVGCHAYAQDEAFSILLFSRDFENDIMVQVDLPDELALIAPENGMKYVISGEGYSARESTLDSVAITMSDSLLVNVPPYSMVVLRFGADASSVEDLPMGAFTAYVSAEEIEIYAYGTDVMDIDVNKQKKLLRTNVLPEDVLSDAVIWTVETNGVEVTAEKKTSWFEIQGSGTDEGNGAITVRATAWDNPEVYDEVTINISNQGSGGTISTGQELAEALILYPNPADNLLTLQGLPEGCERIEILDMSGRILQSLAVEQSTEIIQTGHLDQGMYYLRIHGKGDVLVRSFVKE